MATKPMRLKKKFFYKIFISYFVIIIIALSIVVINLSNTTYIADKQDEEFFTSNLKVVKDIIEIKVANVRNLFLQITNNNWAEKLMFMNPVSREDESYDKYLNSYDTYEAIKDLAHYKNSVNGIQSIGIFYKEGDFVIDHSSINGATDYYKKIFRIDGMEVSNWYELASTFQNFGILSFNSAVFNDKQIAGTTFYKTIPANDSNVKGLIFATVTREYFNNAIKALHMDEYTYGLIIDEHNKIIANTSNFQNSIPLLKYTAFIEDVSTINDKENKYIYHAGKIKFMPWKVILISQIPPASTILSFPGYYILALIIILALSIAIAYVLSLYSYRPLHHLYTSFSPPGMEKVPTRLPINEFVEIESRLSIVSGQNRLLYDQINTYKLHLTENFMYSMARNEAISNKYEAVTDEFHKDFSKGKAAFVMIIGQSDHIGTIQRFMKNIGLVFHIIQDLDNNLVFLVWLPDIAGDQTKSYAHLIGQITQHKNKMEGKSMTKMVVCMSDLCYSTDAIAQAFKQAKHSFRFNTIFNINPIDHSKEYSSLVSATLPLETETALLNFLKTGDFEKIYEKITQINKSYEDKQVINAYEGTTLLYELVAILIRYIESQRMDEDAIDKSTLLQLKSIHDIIDLYKDLCDQIKLKNQQAVSENHDIKKEIVAFIQQNYLNPNMSLQLVKDRFEISFALITRLVKRESGYGFLEFLSRIRVDYARILLQNTEESITKIREITGFNDDSNFIKIFKRYAGVTPGEYRKKIAAEKKQVNL